MTTGSQTPMTEDRRNAIAYLLIKERLLKDRVSMDPEQLKRELPSRAEALGIPLEDMVEFLRFLLAELTADVDTAFDEIIIKGKNPREQYQDINEEGAES